MSGADDFFIDGRAGRLSVRAKGVSGAAQIVVLVQGSNLAGQSMFDFSFAGGKDYSVMDAVAAMGFGAVTFAIRGYGLSEPPEDPFTVNTEAAMEDLASVMEWARGQGFAKPHLLGFSWGGRVAGRYAETHADQIGRLVLYDPARGGGDRVTTPPTDAWWINEPEHYAEKLEPELTDPALREALGAHVLEYARRSPNGIRMENANPVIGVVPEKITNPTLLVYGVEAAKAPYMQGGIPRAEFFERLATDDKVFAILPGGGDFAHFQAARYRLHKVIEEFLWSDAP